MNERAETISRGEAARRLERAPRTIARWAERGLLTRLDDGSFLAAEVEALIDRGAPADDAPDGELDREGSVRELAKVTQRMLARDAAMFDKYVKAVDQLLERSQQDHARMAAQLESQAEQLRRAQEFEGDLLLRREERDELARSAEHRRTEVSKAIQTITPYLPAITAHLMGREPKDLDSKALEFVRGLEEEERYLIAQMLAGLGERGQGMLDLMRAADPETVQKALESAEGDGDGDAEAK